MTFPRKRKKLQRMPTTPDRVPTAARTLGSLTWSAFLTKRRSKNCVIIRPPTESPYILSQILEKRKGILRLNSAKNLPDTVSGYPGAMVYVDFTARGIQRKPL